MKTIVIAILVSLITALVAVQFMKDGPSQATRETAYERVMRTKILHCGGFDEPPFTMNDPNTGERNGIVVDIINRFAADYDLQIEWETISNFAMMGEDLKLGKYDAVCASLINMPRGGLIDPVDAFAFVPTYGYVRADENRFTSLAELNNSAFKIAGQEGAAVTMVARQKFPQAQFHIIPSAELSEMLASVVAKKADIAFMIPSFYQEYVKNNPGTLKPLPSKESLQTFSFAFGIKPGEEGLKSLFNTSLHRMLVSGDLEASFRKHDLDETLSYPILSASPMPAAQ